MVWVLSKFLESQWILDKENTNAKDLGNDLLSEIESETEGAVRLLVNSWDCYEVFSHDLIHKGKGYREATMSFLRLR